MSLFHIDKNTNQYNTIHTISAFINTEAEIKTTKIFGTSPFSRCHLSYHSISKPSLSK